MGALPHIPLLSELGGLLASGLQAASGTLAAATGHHDPFMQVIFTLLSYILLPIYTDCNTILVVQPPTVAECVGPRASFPLKLQSATDYTKHRVALVGDAAHTVHPMAGQVTHFYMPACLLPLLLLESLLALLLFRLTTYHYLYSL